jgi:Protein of unknown function (DUF1501)
MMPMSTRRQLLSRLSCGFGLAAFAGLTAARPAVTKLRPRARSVIFCYMSGGVSHVDSFDPKPELARRAGQPMPMAVARTQFNQNGAIQPSHWAFKPRGQSGLEISELFPHLAQCADDLCVVRSMTAKFSEHAQGNFFMHSGFPFLGYPSAGAWASYGLGSVAENLPGFVVLQSGGAVAPHGGVGLFSNGFLPAVHQASIINADDGEPVANIKPREPGAAQRSRMDFVARMDRKFAAGDAQVEAAITNAEMAWRMQSAVPELCDIRGETEATRKLYALDDADTQTAAYGRQCLLARRMVERGVRFIELSCLSHNIGGGNAPNPWDQHGDIVNGHGRMAHQVDRPIAGLLRDLKARGLLDETLVIFSGEFGRTPFSQSGNGRDHNPSGFSLWMAGGGVKPGFVYGATDDFGYHAVADVCTVYDLWATVLHQLGVDHDALTYRHSGRDIRLTDVHGHVLHRLLA